MGGLAPETLKRSASWGFTPETVARFRIDDGNRNRFISERDYAFLYPLNGKYGKWVRDRVTAQRIFHSADECFEVVHYHLLRRDEGIAVIPLSEQAKRLPATVEGIAELIVALGPLTLTGARWSTDETTTLSSSGKGFEVGDDCYSASGLARYLVELVKDEPYVLFESAEETCDLAALAANGTATVRLLVVNENGISPKVTESAVVVRDEFGFFELNVDVGTGCFVQARALCGDTIKDFSKHPGTGAQFSGVVPQWVALRQEVEQLLLLAPQLRFIELEVLPDDDGSFRVVSMSDAPKHSTALAFDRETVRFLEEQVAVKKASALPLSTRSRKWFVNLGRTIRRQWGRLIFPSGLVPYQSVRWIGDVSRDLVARNGVPLRQKFWAYRNGFLSYRIPQYGLTPQNREQYISDFEYRWLRHINRDYRHWLEDKISLKHIAAEFSDLLPAYYFHTHAHSDGVQVTALMDCEDEGNLTLENVLELVTRVGTVALKPDEGSHGDGFYRLDLVRGEYRLNGTAVSEADVLDVLSNPENDYLVTEFIEMHPDIARIYPKSVNTVRMIVFREGGGEPQIGNSYLRIGSEQSGYVDNTAQGGMFAEIDVATGRFGNGQALKNGKVVSCPIHPDTGEVIYGQLPDWENVKESVLRVAESMPQLEYLGFDVAITPGGCTIPEVNRFPDYPRIERLTPATTRYLLGKLEAKKREHGYDCHRPRSLVGLPRRDGGRENE